MTCVIVNYLFFNIFFKKWKNKVKKKGTERERKEGKQIKTKTNLTKGLICVMTAIPLILLNSEP